MDTIAPILRRGVLIDVAGRWRPLRRGFRDHARAPGRRRCAARATSSCCAPDGAAITRTRADSSNDTRCPGPGLAAAQWLSARGIFAAGSDTVPFERSPDPKMPVHVHLLVESGIHIIECLNLEELARDGVREFFFVGAPMKIRGATGAPIRPLAIV